MALGTLTHGASGGASSNSSDIVSGSFTPPADSLIIVTLYGGKGTGAPTHDSITTTLSINGSFTKLAEKLDTSAGGFARISVWYAFATATPGTGTVTGNYGGNTANRRTIIADYITGADTTAPLIQAKTAENGGGSGTGDTMQITLDSALGSGSIAAGSVVSTGDSTGITPGAGDSEVSEATSGGSNEGRVQTEYSPDNVLDWSDLNDSSAQVNLGIAFEIAEDSGGGGGGTILPMMLQHYYGGPA